MSLSNKQKSGQESQRAPPLLATPSADTSGRQDSASAATSAAIHNVKVHSQTSWQMLHMDGKTMLRENKQIVNKKAKPIDSVVTVIFSNKKEK